MKHTFIILFFALMWWSCATDSSAFEQIKAQSGSIRNFGLENLPNSTEFAVLGNGLSDSTAYFERIDRLFFAADTYYILDRSIGDYYDLYVKIFDRSGRYLSRYYLGGIGDSPFKIIKDLWTDGKTIMLLDYGRSGIWQASLDREVLNWSLNELGEGFEKFYPLDKGVFIVDGDNTPTASLAMNNLGTIVSMNNQATIIDTAVSIPPFFRGVGVVGSRFVHDQKTNRHYYSPPSGPDIYEIMPSGSISGAFTVDLGANAYDFKANPGLSQDNFLEIRRNQAFIMGFDKVVAWNNLFLFQYRYDNSFYWVLINKENGQSIVLKPDFPFIDYFRTGYTPQYVDDQGWVHFRLQRSEVFDYVQAHPGNVLSQKLGKIERLTMDDGVVIMRFPLEALMPLLNS